MASLANIFEDQLKRLNSLFSFQDYLMLWLRVWVARIFYDSGRTKAGDNYLEINDFQGMLFEEEYGISFIDPEIAAQLALYAETFLPLALLFGLASRLGALGLLGMTLFIQVFVYPTHFFEHATWAVALIAISICGAGKFSFDYLVKKNLK